MILILTSSCNKDKDDKIDTLKNLYNTYKNGEIDECKYNSMTVFIAGINAYDAGSTVYDLAGNKIGTCNYAWGIVDSICLQLRDCEVIYRCKDHITGEHAIDKYGLGN